VVVHRRAHRRRGRALSPTSAKLGGLSGVFISVTTVPAAGNIALALALSDRHELWDSTLQLIINLTGMGLAGWATLTLQKIVWTRISLRRNRPRTSPHE
jgi:hypothetical protein